MRSTNYEGPHYEVHIIFQTLLNYIKIKFPKNDTPYQSDFCKVCHTVTPLSSVTTCNESNNRNVTHIRIFGVSRV